MVTVPPAWFIPLPIPEFSPSPFAIRFPFPLVPTLSMISVFPLVTVIPFEAVSVFPSGRRSVTLPVTVIRLVISVSADSE